MNKAQPKNPSKLTLSKETLKNLSTKSGVKAGQAAKDSPKFGCNYVSLSQPKTCNHC